MTMTRRAKKAKRRAAARRRMLKARRAQSRRGGRMSSRGYRKAKRSRKSRSRRLPKRSTFMKLRRRARNPMHEADWRHDYRNGASIEVWNDGEVVITDPMGRDMDDFFLKPYEVARFKKEVASAPGQWTHWMKDMIHDEFEFQARSRRNPRARPNENDIPTVRIRRRNCGNPRRNPAAVTKYLRDGSTIKVSDHGEVTIIYQGQEWDSYRIGQGRLAHFIKDITRSANRDRFDYKGDDLAAEGSYSVKHNPRRKGRGHRGSRKKSRRGRPLVSWYPGRKTRRNPAIAKRDAAAIKRVLRKHGYKCR